MLADRRVRAKRKPMMKSCAQAAPCGGHDLVRCRADLRKASWHDGVAGQINVLADIGSLLPTTGARRPRSPDRVDQHGAVVDLVQPQAAAQPVDLSAAGGLPPRSPYRARPQTSMRLSTCSSHDRRNVNVAEFDAWRRKVSIPGAGFRRRRARSTDCSTIQQACGRDQARVSVRC